MLYYMYYKLIKLIMNVAVKDKSHQHQIVI